MFLILENPMIMMNKKSKEEREEREGGKGRGKKERTRGMRRNWLWMGVREKRA